MSTSFWVSLNSGKYFLMGKITIFLRIWLLSIIIFTSGSLAENLKSIYLYSSIYFDKDNVEVFNASINVNLGYIAFEDLGHEASFIVNKSEQIVSIQSKALSFYIDLKSKLDAWNYAQVRYKVIKRERMYLQGVEDDVTFIKAIHNNGTEQLILFVRDRGIVGFSFISDRVDLAEMYYCNTLRCFGKL